MSQKRKQEVPDYAIDRALRIVRECFYWGLLRRHGGKAEGAARHWARWCRSLL